MLFRNVFQQAGAELLPIIQYNLGYWVPNYVEKWPYKLIQIYFGCAAYGVGCVAYGVGLAACAVGCAAYMYAQWE